MCGICGLIDRAENEKSAWFVEQMNKQVMHRGPDAAGYYSAASVHFAHRRLSIIDLDPSAGQPFRTEDYVLVFNGEIYNYRELRKELAGYPFRTESDTEVILAAWQRWGENCAQHLRGMWAFALYDKRQNIIFCSRDRFGIKPFYYYETDTFFSFASEIKQFTCLPNWTAKANRARILDFLLLEMMDHTTETMFEGVLQLAPGHNLLYDLAQGNHAIVRYYSLEAATSVPLEDDYEAACHKFLKQMEETIEEHLNSDVPIGSCLSGGLDSSTIVSLVHRRLENEKNTRQITVSSCSTDPQTDEQEYIDEVVQRLGLESHKIWPHGQELLQCLEKISWHQDEPFLSTSIFAQWKVFEVAHKQGAKVMLDGQGADEILAGYGGVYGLYLAELLHAGHFGSCMHEIHSLCLKDGHSVIALFGLIVAELMPRWLKGFLRSRSKKGIAGFIHTDDDFYKNNLQPLYRNKTKTMREFSIWMLETTSLPQLLHFEDRDSMAFSVEARVPFLDHRLVEMALRMPTAYKVHDGLTKQLLRDAMKGILPEKIRNRRSKLGFETPESVWIRENRDSIQTLFLQGLKVLEYFADEDKALLWFNREIKDSGKIDRGLWRVVSIGIWAKVFGVTV